MSGIGPETMVTCKGDYTTETLPGSQEIYVKTIHNTYYMFGRQSILNDQSLACE